MIEAGVTDGSEQLVIELMEQRARDLGPGGKLPTERELVTLTGLSRPTVRRALDALEAEGKILRQRGRGTFLAGSPAQEAAPVDTAQIGASPVEIMAARLLVEPSTMPLVVAAGTPADLAEIERCLRGGNQTDSYQEFALWGTALHRAMAKATHNRMLVHIGELYDLHADPQWRKLLRRSSNLQRLADYKDDHTRIVAALAERDADTAQLLMRQHLQRIQSNVLGVHPY